MTEGAVDFNTDLLQFRDRREGCMATSYSIWLLADRHWSDLLKGIIDALADRFSAPRFDPHLTLLEGRPYDLDVLDRTLRSSASAPVTAPIADLLTGEDYFRSFYALFEAAVPLVMLRRAIHASLPGAPAGEFMPHVSLLYGPVAPDAKAEAAAAYRRELKGRRVTFNRIAIVHSGGDVPIEDWREIAAVPLGR